jgi:hypothetical protein
MKTSIIAVAKNENIYISEWIKHHIDIGFDEILLFDNCSEQPLSNEIDLLPEKYKKAVLLKQFSSSIGAQDIILEQGLAHYRQNHVDWLAHIDIDEFVIPNVILKDYLASQSRRIGAIYLHWKQFNANGLEKYENKPVMERFSKHLGRWYQWHGKSIFRPELVVSPGVHYPRCMNNAYLVNTLGTTYGPSGSIETCYSKLWINHYYTKSYEEWLWKILRGSSHMLALKRYSSFFKYNPDLRHLFDNRLSSAFMNDNNVSHKKVVLELIGKYQLSLLGC